MDGALQALIAAVGSFIIVSLLIGALLLLCRRPAKPPSLAAVSPAARPILPETSAMFDPAINHISMAELTAATKNFSADAILGDGSFGFVYKAQLSSGATVAVKRLSTDAFHGPREFRAEMETLGRIHHPNLARLLGYCVSGPDRLLIYEFLPGGSLDHWLYPPDSAEPGRLSFSDRLGILRGVAAGLSYLHEDCTPSIIHRDIKASNVLLDADLGARIADFGLARWVDSARSHVSTQVAGTMGYMAPEYREGNTAATWMADVYSFGILMFEVATGRRPSWPMKGEDGREVSLVRWARAMVEAGRGIEIVDPLMGKEGLRSDHVDHFLTVAHRCTNETGRKRPRMSEVLFSLTHLPSHSSIPSVQ
ncbi:hypothetical protein J5N97_012350 [Dioscorea zingiberensis]|uniref:Protein kinase domain-containing protein n=1 Tax=Dioscorea zingiberensis TaxID=325984 RepID=A0A9D5HHM0_9LILI|nr:hypothetical protein J5N97_012350 [Dioscorea zingiberensis]